MKSAALVVLLAGVLLSACGGSAANTPPSLIDTGIDSEAWALIPAGEFLFGRHSHEELVEYDYEMMVTDVTNAQYANYLNAALEAGSISIVGDQVVGYYPGDVYHGLEHEIVITSGEYIHVPIQDPKIRLDYNGEQFTAKTGYENHPMTQVSWFGAKAYCEFYSWRLPSEVEWEKAARGEDGRAFPWGEQIALNNANYYSSHDLYEKVVGGLGDTTPVGFYNGGVHEGYATLDSPSPYGLYDMAGNVWQWTSDIYEGQHYRYLRGGSKMDYEYNLRAWTRNNAGPEYYSPSVGFRCAR